MNSELCVVDGLDLEAESRPDFWLGAIDPWFAGCVATQVGAKAVALRCFPLVTSWLGGAAEAVAFPFGDAVRKFEKSTTKLTNYWSNFATHPSNSIEIATTVGIPSPRIMEGRRWDCASLWPGEEEDPVESCLLWGRISDRFDSAGDLDHFSPDVIASGKSLIYQSMLTSHLPIPAIWLEDDEEAALRIEWAVRGGTYLIFTIEPDGLLDYYSRRGNGGDPESGVIEGHDGRLAADAVIVASEVAIRSMTG